MKTTTPRPIRLKDYEPPAFLIDHVDLNFNLHPTATTVTSRLKIRHNPDAATSSGSLKLDGEHLDLKAIKLNGKTLSADLYSKTDSALSIHDVPTDAFRLEITTLINPDENTALQGLYRSRGIYCTQCEAEGFRRITYFLDRPDVLATYTTRIEADRTEATTLLSNGNPIETGRLDGGRRVFSVWKDPHPKPSYLFALVGGHLKYVRARFKTASDRPVELRIYVEPGKENRCAWAMDCLKRSMVWDEERFGREYDLDVFNIVAVSDFNMGAMENKGLNIFNDRLILASPDTATDMIYLAIESVVAHEYFHNWTGNRITCRDWFQLCLKEGLTVFRDQEFTADERDRAVERIASVRQLRAHQFPEDAGPLAHPVRPSSYIEINNFYTATVYEKGAELVRMLQTICGVEGFRNGMDIYFDRHDGDAATVEDFIDCFEDATSLDLGQFRIWYQQAGTPELSCQLTFDREKRTAQLAVEQILPPTPGQAKKKPLHIPLKFGLLNKAGDDIPLQLSDGTEFPDGVLQVTRRKQRFTFSGIASRPVASYLRGFSAPVKLTAKQSERDLAFLMVNDSDMFARWQAANDYATRILTRLVRARDHKPLRTRIERYARALEVSLSDPVLDDAYLAELLKVPSENDIAREVGRNVNPDAILEARKLFSGTVARALGGALEQLMDQTQVAVEFSPDAASAGRRSLRNAALTLLTFRGSSRDRKRLCSHFAGASCMTDEAHALHLLAASGGQARDKALERFYQRWQHDHLVVDTWFSVQAAVPARSTLARVKSLLGHPKFAMTTPNKVRALIGTFATQNPSQFHRSDGAGYHFVAEQVLALDKVNPQIAARLLAAFRSWRTMELGRRKQAQAILARLSKTPSLSRDVFEIADKMLGKTE
ncbi:MAG: aminopeptidase N [Hyphomicrobiaceae bacterium]